jgi:hypothetical protein
MLKNGENSVKIDKSLSGGRRVVGITSDATLGHMDRATSICIDVIFIITQKHWFQVCLLLIVKFLTGKSNWPKEPYLRT